MNFLYYLTGAALLVSIIADRKKTFMALKIAFKKFIKIIPAFVIMLILVSIVLFFVTDELISTYLVDSNRFFSMISASAIGAITLMPGFIVYPLCGILKAKGVLYMVLSAFTTTLMMVGILTFSIEKEYFGIKVTLLRNAMSFVIAIIIAVITGFFYGEII